MVSVEPELDGERSLRLTRAEFAALAAVLGERPPKLAGQYAVSAAELRTALAALLGRGVVCPGEPLQVPVAAARLVDIACRPVLAVDIHTARAGRWRPVPDRLAAVPEATVEIAADVDAWRLTPFATAGLLRRLADRCALAGRGRPGAPGAALPLAALRAAVAAAPDGAGPAAEVLVAGGAPEATAAAAGAALAGGGLVAVGVRMRAGPGRRTGGEFAWVAGADGCWWLPPALSPVGDVAGDPAGGPESIAGGELAAGECVQRRADGDLTGWVGPASPEEILVALAAALPSGWLAP